MSLDTVERFQRHYLLREVLGVGATSEVYRAVRLSDSQDLALKVFSPAVFKNEDGIQRLETETEVLKTLVHPNVVRVFSNIKVGPTLALELEFVDGGDLGRWKDNYKLDLLEPKLWVLARVARGLGAAHEAGVLHRDLKPENVLVAKNGDVKLTDFGVAKLKDKSTITKTGFLVGSLGYMAPEIVDGQRATVQSDIFSFGALAYELLGGQAPFADETAQGTIKKLAIGAVTSLREMNPLVPREMESLLMKCLDPVPIRRPDGAWTVESQILGYLHKRQMLVHARRLVGESHRDQNLIEVLAKKHEALSAEMKSFSEIFRHTDQDRRLAVELWTESKTLFPQAPIPTDIVAFLQRGSLGSRYFHWTICSFLVFVFLVVLARPLNVDLRSHSVTIPPDKKDLTDVQYERASGKRVKTRLTEVQLPGALVFGVDDDVRVWLDNREIISPGASTTQLPPGTYQVLLAKPGFLPLKKTIQISSGKETLINAK